MSECKECILVDSLEKRVNILEGQIQSINETITELNRENGKFHERFERVLEKIEHIEKSLDKIVFKLENLEQTPANYWKLIVTATISTAITIFITQLLK